MDIFLSLAEAEIGKDVFACLQIDYTGIKKFFDIRLGDILFISEQSVHNLISLLVQPRSVFPWYIRKKSDMRT